jgi:hypothetical protein
MKGRGKTEGGEGERTERRFCFWWRGGDRGAEASWAWQIAQRGEWRRMATASTVGSGLGVTGGRDEYGVGWAEVGHVGRMARWAGKAVWA